MANRVPTNGRTVGGFRFGWLLLTVMAALLWTAFGGIGRAQAASGIVESDPAENLANSTPHITLVATAESAADPLTCPDRYRALQLFKAESSGDASVQLSNIEWGASIKPEELLKALAASHRSIGSFNTSFTDSEGKGTDGDGEAAELSKTYGTATELGQLFCLWLHTTKPTEFESDSSVDDYLQKDKPLTDAISARDLATFLVTFAQIGGMPQAADPSDNTPFPSSSPFSSSRVLEAFVQEALVSNNLDAETEGENVWTSRALYDDGGLKAADAGEASQHSDKQGLAWVIYHEDPALPDGYYLVQDTLAAPRDGETASDVVSEPIVRAIGQKNVALYVKTDYPTIDKIIVAADAEGADGVDADSVAANDRVSFRLTGTLPENVKSFRGAEGANRYAMTFKDALGEALTVDGESVRVYVGTAEKTPGAEGGATLIYQASGEDGKNVTITPEQHELTVAIDNIFALTQADNDDPSQQAAGGVSIPINDFSAGPDASVLYVTYDATVAADASHLTEQEHRADLQNSAKLEYSNNPSAEGMATTTEVTTQCYTYGIDIHKVDEANSPVTGAGFSLFKAQAGDSLKEAGDDAEIALFTRNDEGQAGPAIYSFAKWATPKKTDGALDETVTEASAGAGPGQTTYYQICTVAAGSAKPGELALRGLDVGAYTLRETKTPAGYDTADAHTWQFTATETPEQSGLSVKTPGGATSSTVSASGPNDDLYTLTVTDRAGLILPLTGGPGAIALVAIGALLVAGAVVYGAASRRRSVRAAKHHGGSRS